MEDLERISLFWLLPTNASHSDVPINSLRPIFNDVQIFDDPDECVDLLTSFKTCTIFLVVASGRSNLVPIVSSIDELCYIYLSESHHSSSTPKVRGVFPNPEILFNQLRKDVKIIERRFITK